MKYRAIVATDAPCLAQKPRGIIRVENLLIWPGMPLPDRLPLLDNHSLRGSVQVGILGRADNFRVVEIDDAFGGKLNAIEADVTLAQTYTGKEIELLVSGGHVWALSVGFSANQIEILDFCDERTFQGITFSGGRQVITSFNLEEVSLTATPLDKNCRIMLEQETLK